MFRPPCLRVCILMKPLSTRCQRLNIHMPPTTGHRTSLSLASFRVWFLPLGPSYLDSCVSCHFQQPHFLMTCTVVSSFTTLDACLLTQHHSFRCQPRRIRGPHLLLLDQPQARTSPSVWWHSCPRLSLHWKICSPQHCPTSHQKLISLFMSRM